MQEVSKPLSKNNQILVKIVATAVNSGDVRLMNLDLKGFMKVIRRLVLGISKPRKPILGNVFSGIVECAGKKVSWFKIDDKVFGMTGFNSKPMQNISQEINTVMLLGCPKMLLMKKPQK